MSAEFREWLVYWLGSGLGIIGLGTLIALAHKVASGG